MRTDALLYVNCDRCTLEQEVILDRSTHFQEQADQEIECRGWLVTDEEDICPECRKEKEKCEQQPSST